MFATPLPSNTSFLWRLLSFRPTAGTVNALCVQQSPLLYKVCVLCLLKNERERVTASFSLKKNSAVFEFVCSLLKKPVPFEKPTPLNDNSRRKFELAVQISDFQLHNQQNTQLCVNQFSRDCVVSNQPNGRHS